MFLVIENCGVAPVESFTMLGLSTARGNAAKIGQFGSGAKHGILTAIRHKTNPRIFLGKDELAFYTEPGKMGDKAYDKLCYLWKDKIESTSMVLEFGALDWNGLDMALREFVSNAIDASNGETLVKVGLRPTIEPQADKTLVAFELTPNVNKFYSELPFRFLQFNPNYSEGVPVGPISKIEPNSKAKVYRKGVFVRESAHHSLFDYNFGEETKIDESRNMADYAVTESAAECWKSADDKTLAMIMPYLTTMNAKTFEYHFYSYSLCESYSPQTQKDKFVRAFNTIHGNDTIIFNEANAIAVKAINKGYKAIHVTSNGWYKALESAGIQTVNQVMKQKHDTDEFGRELLPAPSSLVARCAKIWNKLERNHLTNGRDMPNVKTFNSLMDGGNEMMGFYDKTSQTIVIHRDYTRNIQTILEEMAHHITGSTDNSRDFQDYAFKLAAYFMTRKAKG